MAEKDQQVITQEDYENPPTQLLPPRIFLASKEKNNQPINQPTDQPTDRPTNQPTSNVVGAQPTPCCWFRKMVIQAAHLLVFYNLHTDIAPKNHPTQPNQHNTKKI